MAEKIRTMHENKQILLKRLKISETPKKKSLSSRQIELYSLHSSDMFELWRRALPLKANDDKMIQISVDHKFDLQDKFDSWLRSVHEGECDPTYLFVELDEKNSGLWLQAWKVFFYGKNCSLKEVAFCIRDLTILFCQTRDSKR